ncbi:DMT family transporter [Bacillus massiliigorillae]|uniref:DMT family transporter n=1 Tax=Bacillus massiliigorillae TaxID=1243664 RepID=UPI0003A70DB6|nr:DMT family transporter [Bacillus massiliigorillae]
MQEKGSNMQVKADIMMLIVTICWGSSYLFMKIGLDSLQGFTLIFLRFIFAFILAAVVFYKRLLKVNMKTIKYSFILGTVLFFAFAFLAVGMRTTTASNAGFLVSLAVIFVPVISGIFLKQKTEFRLVIGVSTALIGIALLTLNSHFQLSIGDFYCIICALLYSVHIILTGKLTKHVDSISLGVLQLGFVAAWGFIFSLLFEAPQLPQTVNAWIAVLALSIICSALGFIIQTIAQQHTTPTHTGLIFSLEPIFSALFAFIFIGETLTVRGYIGATLVILGILFAEINFKKLFLKKEQSNVTI